MTDYHPFYPALEDQLTKRGIDVEWVKARLKAQKIETPSWGYGNSGTRFKVFTWPGAARDVHEKLADAAYVHKLTGIAPSVALHIPWDKTDDWQGLKHEAEALGVTIGAINPNVFQDDEYKLGSLTNPSPTVQEQALAHIVECCEIMAATGSDLLSLWFADGTNYAGQDSFSERKHRLEHGLKVVYEHLPAKSRMLVEYKFFEPAFHSTDLPDWGTAYAMALKLGEQAQVLVDTGHHPQGTNIAAIVAFLLDEGRLGGFHFNARQYADDDLIVGTTADVAYMIDQSHNIEPKLEAMIQSVVNCQASYARALIVDRTALKEAQHAGDVLGGHRILVEAFETDVRPLLAEVRSEMGVPNDPIAAYRADNYAKQVADQRGAASGALGGYPG
jgi:L-rhamnose isomerase / sugar isomerase